MDAKKFLTNSMTSFEKDDMAGKNEWLGELNPRKFVGGIHGIFSTADFENPLWVMLFNPLEPSARLLV